MRFVIKPFIGDTVFLQVSFTKDNAPFSLAGCTVFFTIKEDPDQSDDEALLALISNDGITHSGSDAEIYIAGEKTVNAPVGVPLVADIQVRTADGDIFTAATGKVIFKSDVTKARV